MLQTTKHTLENSFLLTPIAVPAISLWDFLNRDSDLVAQVSTCIDYPVSAFS